MEQAKAKTTRMRPVVVLPLMRSPAQFCTLVYIEGSESSWSSADLAFLLDRRTFQSGVSIRLRHFVSYVAMWSRYRPIS